MVQVALSVHWFALALSLRSATKATTGIIPVAVLGIITLIFLVVGVLAFFRIRWLNRRVAGTPSQRIQPRASLQRQQGLSLVPALALIIPVAMIVFTWWGNTIIPIIPPTPTSEVNPPPTLKPSPTLDLVTPGVLTIGTIMPTTDLFNPFQIEPGQNPDQPTGFDIDLIKAIAKQLGLKASFKEMAFSGLVGSLTSNQLDVVVAAYPLTSDVSSIPNVPYLNPHEQVLILKKTSKITSFKALTDLCGHTVGVLQGSNEDIALQNTAKTCPQNLKMAITEEKTIGAVSSDLTNKQVDATYQDSPTSLYYQSQSPGIFEGYEAKNLGTPEGILVGNAALLPSIQRAFALLMQNGTYSSLLQQYGLSHYSISQ